MGGMAKAQFDYLVNVSESAFRSLTLATIESYSGVSPPRGKGKPRQYLETYGLLWGYETKLRSGKPCITVEAATTDINAERDHSSVTPSRTGLQTMNAIVSSYWPNWRFIGDFHSHPFKPGQSMPARPALSDDDVESVESDDSIYTGLGYRVCLLTSIRQMRREGSKDPVYLGSNALEWTMHNLRLSLAAWVAVPQRGRKLKLYPLDHGHGRPRASGNRTVWLLAPVQLIHEKLGA